MSTAQSNEKTLIVVHDVLGTLFDLSQPIEVIKRIFHSQLGTDPTTKDRFAELIIMDWYHAAQRDFSFLSINGAYKPIGQVFQSTLSRVLLQAGLVPPPLSSSSGKEEDTEEVERVRRELSASAHGSAEEAFEDVTREVMASLQRLRPRAGMVEAFTSVYREGGGGVGGGVEGASSRKEVHLWGATNGSLPLAENLFSAALPSLSISPAHSQSGVGIWSCDEVRIAKPDPRVYEQLKRRVLAAARLTGEEQADLFFVASHSWDLDAAKRAGFHTLWVGYEEFSACTGIYLAPDLVAKDLQDGARKILKWVEGGR